MVKATQGRHLVAFHIYYFGFREKNRQAARDFFHRDMQAFYFCP